MSADTALQWRRWASDKPTASHWHDMRRAAIIRAHPEVLKLMGPDVRTPLVTLGMTAGHVALAVYCGRHSWRAAVVAAAGLGGLLAFDLQGLNHELSHQSLRSGLVAQQPWYTRWALHGLCNRLVSNICGLLASATTAVPWFAYYFAGGHALHHMHAGTPYDSDSTALFWAWEAAPAKWLDSPWGTLAWVSTVAAFLPALYFASLGYWFVVNPLSNVKEMTYASLDMGAKAGMYYAVYRLAGVRGITYLLLSSAFSMGFCGHPMLAFWIAQHQCIDPPSATGATKSQEEMQELHNAAISGYVLYQNDAQPSLSYYGSALWNWLTVNELLHVEHHDFSNVPWTRLPQLTKIAPEFYGQKPLLPTEGKPPAFSKPLQYFSSIYGDLILPWLWKRGQKFDFACRSSSLHHIVNRMRMAQTVRERLGLAPLRIYGDEDDEEEDEHDDADDDDDSEDQNEFAEAQTYDGGADDAFSAETTRQGQHEDHGPYYDPDPKRPRQSTSHASPGDEVLEMTRL